MNEQSQVSQHTYDLLNGGIDGELNSGEQAELQELLAGSSDIHDLNTELTALADILNKTPEREPPEYLQQAIINTVRLPVAHKQDEKRGLLTGWLPSHWLRTGFALAAGAVLTVGIYEIGSEPISGEDAASMAGTIVAGSQSMQGELIDSIHINNGLLDGIVELRAKENFLILDVQLNSDGPTELNVEFADRGLEFEGITRLQDHKDAVSVLNGSVIVASSGAQHYALKLRNTLQESSQESAPLVVEFFANNALVHKAELSTSKH